MARKKPSAPKATDADFERLEVQLPRGFLARLDRARQVRGGLSRAAYARHAMLLLMAEDDKKDQSEEK